MPVGCTWRVMQLSCAFAHGPNATPVVLREYYGESVIRGESVIWGEIGERWVCYTADTFLECFTILYQASMRKGRRLRLTNWKRGLRNWKAKSPTSQGLSIVSCVKSIPFALSLSKGGSTSSPRTDSERLARIERPWGTCGCSGYIQELPLR